VIQIKRGKKYDGFILDPPAFGRGPKKPSKSTTAHWELGKDLSRLLELVAQLLSDNPLFVLLTCHDPTISGKELAGGLAKHVPLRKFVCGSGVEKKGRLVYGEVDLQPLASPSVAPDSLGVKPKSVWSGSYAKWSSEHTS
jgi:hypothetical protein